MDDFAECLRSFHRWYKLQDNISWIFTLLSPTPLIGLLPRNPSWKKFLRNTVTSLLPLLTPPPALSVWLKLNPWRNKCCPLPLAQMVFNMLSGNDWLLGWITLTCLPFGPPLETWQTILLLVAPLDADLRTNVSLFYTKGDPMLTKNYHPISSMNTDCKMYTNLVNSCLALWAVSKIHTDQKGFTPGRYITEHTCLASEVSHLSNATSTNGYIVSLDQAKAYDRTDLPWLLSVLSAMGIDAHLVSLINVAKIAGCWGWARCVWE